MKVIHVFAQVKFLAIHATTQIARVFRSFGIILDLEFDMFVELCLRVKFSVAISKSALATAMQWFNAMLLLYVLFAVTNSGENFITVIATLLFLLVFLLFEVNLKIFWKE